MATEYVLTPRNSRFGSSISVRSLKRNSSLSNVMKKSVSKPFVGQKVAALKASANKLAIEIKRQEKLLDGFLDQEEGQKTKKKELENDIESLAVENDATVKELEGKIEEEIMTREAEEKEAEEELEVAKRRKGHEVLKLKVKTNELHADVWSDLNERLKEFKAAGRAENMKTAAENNAALEEKDNRLKYIQKERRSARKSFGLIVNSVPM